MSNQHAWENETSRYHSRLRALLAVTPPDSFVLADLWHRPQESQRDHALVLALGFCAGLTRQAYEVAQIVAELWFSGRFVAVPLNSRFVYECWGAVCYARDALEQQDEERLSSTITRLTTGAHKAVVRLPWGPPATEKSPNVMEYIRVLKGVDEMAEDNYSFLCSASHPNTLQNMYFELMGPPVPNWGNDTFRELGHVLLDRVLSLLEQALKGIGSDTSAVISEAELLRQRLVVH